ncbi:MAG: methylated-DNA--[protein]-cysteine S-methyltransferase [Angustibacter sp.]
MPTWTTTVASPIGDIRLAADDDGALTHLVFRDEQRFPGVGDGLRLDQAPFAEAANQLAEYFAGDRRDFDLRLAPRGTTFQARAWRALQAIPYGETRSYMDQARAIGAPAAVRAIGAANGRNPIGIVVPCHRVVGADGSLTGYGGGVHRKRWLLTHEQPRDDGTLFPLPAQGFGDVSGSLPRPGA